MTSPRPVARFQTNFTEMFLLCLFIKIAKMADLFVCVEVLQPSQPNGSCQARSVYLTTRLLGRLSPLSG